MILYACVVRLQDGLPLSASMDFHMSKNVSDSKRKLRALSVSLCQRPERGTAELRELSIHFCSSGDIASLALCSSSYPPSMAFCFLDEVLWEFMASYKNIAIALASRPYAFREFDSVIQRVKHNFNFAASPPAPLESCPPPVCVKLDDIEEVNNIANGYPACSDLSGLYSRLTPVTSIGLLSLTLNIMCSALSLIRGAHLAEHSFQNGYEDAGRIAAFCTAFCANIFQCHLYFFHCSARTRKTCGLLAVICFCNIYLYGERNVWLILFHIGVAVLFTLQILMRKPL
ncbi:vesicle-trafficking SEC22c, partial [Pelobates cultripes]